MLYDVQTKKTPDSFTTKILPNFVCHPSICQCASSTAAQRGFPFMPRVWFEIFCQRSKRQAPTVIQK